MYAIEVVKNGAISIPVDFRKKFGITELISAITKRKYAARDLIDNYTENLYSLQIARF